MTSFPQAYDMLDDATLDIIYGQHIAGTICDSAASVSLPIECSLYQKTAHWAPDEWSRPQPIGAGGEDYERAIDAAVTRFGGLQIDVVLLDASKHVAYIHAPVDPKEPGKDYTRSASGVWDHAHEPDRWRSVRRSVIKCILALADAPRGYEIKRSPPR